MHCDANAARRKLQEYLDGQLPEKGMQSIQAHVQNCPTCQNELALLRQVDDALATFPVHKEPAGFAGRVMDQIRTDKAAVQVIVSPAFPLPWQEILTSFGFALAMTGVLLTIAQLQRAAPKSASVRIWYIWIRNLSHLWHLVQTEPAFAVWGAASLGILAASMVAIIMLVQRWPNQWTERSTTN